MCALAVDAELGVFQAAQAVAKLRKKRAVLRLARIEGLLRGAEDGPGMAVILAHLPRGVAFIPLFGESVLRIERQNVGIAPGLQMQKEADLREMQEGSVQLPVRDPAAATGRASIRAGSRAGRRAIP